MELTGGRVFVTDCRSPAARSAAERLARDGFAVVVNGIYGGEDEGCAVEGCERARVSLTDRKGLTELLESWGEGLRGVIHPSPEPMHTAIEDSREGQWEAAYSEGALASLMVTGAAGEAMARLGRGALIYLGSMHAEKPMGGGFLYSMACGATQMLCREAALDYGARGVNCVYVRLGPTEGDERNDNAYSNQYKGIEYRYPTRKVPDPDEFGGLISFLMTDGARPLNGSDVNAEGGYTLFYGIKREARRDG